MSVSDYDWAPDGRAPLEWEGKAVETLAAKPLMPRERLNAVRAGIGSSIRNFWLHLDYDSHA